jgi:hypothetical protein
MIFDILTFQLSQPFLEHSPILFYFILFYQKNSNTCSIYIYIYMWKLFNFFLDLNFQLSTKKNNNRVYWILLPYLLVYKINLMQLEKIWRNQRNGSCFFLMKFGLCQFCKNYITEKSTTTTTNNNNNT